MVSSGGVLNLIPDSSQVADILQKEIENGTYGEGELLPSEASLCKRFRLNRYTIRKSLNRLVQIGLILPRKGIGYYVNKKPLEFSYKVTSVTRYSKIIEDLGGVPRAKIINQRKVSPTKTIASALKIGLTEEVYELEIVRYSSELPITWSTTYIPAKLFPGLLEKTESFSSLYSIFEDQYHVTPKRISSTLQAIVPTSLEASYLEISEGTPLIQITSVICDQYEQLIELTFAKYRGDICRVSIDL